MCLISEFGCAHLYQVKSCWTLSIQGFFLSFMHSFLPVSAFTRPHRPLLSCCILICPCEAPLSFSTSKCVPVWLQPADALIGRTAPSVSCVALKPSPAPAASHEETPAGPARVWPCPRLCHTTAPHLHRSGHVSMFQYYPSICFLFRSHPSLYGMIRLHF